MDIYEITGFRTGLDHGGVNFLDPADAFEVIRNGYVYRQELKSRLGFRQFGDRLADTGRVMGIFENVLPDSTKELLVFTKQYMYIYNTGTDAFDQVPFNARILALNPAFNLGITQDDAYITGTTYLTKTGTKRFVFTSKGISIAPLTVGKKNSGVYFYDGTDIGDFFCTDDNPDSQEPASAIGDVVRATTITWFGERLNLFVPQTTVATYNQGILYSGIRDSSGNGDKFNVAGSGLIECDTYELMKSALVNGNIMIMNFERSSWALEKTRDAFNPYFTRKIPSVLGTDAGFSAVAWAYEVKSAGKTGMVTTDGRRAVRFDDKIPRYTQDEFDQGEFELTYGGFDRANAQFLFAYRSNNSTLSSITQDEVLVYNYEENSWAVNTQRFSCFGQTDVGINLVMNDIDETYDPSWAEMDTTEEIMNKIGITAATQKTLAGDNLGFVYQLNQDYDDYFVNISNITQASSCVVTVSPSAFQIGDIVLLDNVEGMTEINGMIGTVLAATDTSLTLNIDTVDFTAYSAGGTVSKEILFETLSSPFNPYRDKGRKVYVSFVEVLLETGGGNVEMEFYVDEEEAPFKTAILSVSDETTKSRQWQGITVDQECNFFTFGFKAATTGYQTIISSVRLHVSAGPMTSW